MTKAQEDAALLKLQKPRSRFKTNQHSAMLVRRTLNIIRGAEGSDDPILNVSDIALTNKRPTSSFIAVSYTHLTLPTKA